MFGVETPAQTLLWRILNEIADFRSEHFTNPTLIEMSEPDWDAIVRSTYHYPPRDDDDPEHPLEDEKIWHEPDPNNREGFCFGVRAVGIKDMAVGDVRIS